MHYPSLKRILDPIAALALTLILFPLLATIVVLTWLESGRPIFFRQTRIGQGGRLFHVIKFRTLHPDCGLTAHPRHHVTRLGRILRRWGLDELPQLWNVVRGDMSLVGPRPVLPSEADHYDTRQRQRLEVKPGLTGWAQTHGRNALDWRERVELDLWYVQHLSLGTDLQILLKTPWVLLSGEGVYGPGNQDPGLHDEPPTSQSSPPIYDTPSSSQG